ncbi:unnamed protein product [Lactuca saligna]|uniref:Uncharacterized protein n=1 Tax=Lactuca saligna TaxID=75948 RepID=A0AA36ED73_LACSI|nr:unnamed protein product [Lactuca saligna]
MEDQDLTPDTSPLPTLHLLPQQKPHGTTGHRTTTSKPSHHTQTSAGMLGSSLPSAILTIDSGKVSVFSLDLESYSSNAKFSHSYQPRNNKTTKFTTSKRWTTQSTRRTQEIVLSEEDTKTWEACRQSLSQFKFTVEEEDKILGKAFGFLHSPYWGEEREKVVPKSDEINAILDYLKGLGLLDDDISKVLKKFPEVVGCSLENEVKVNIQILEKQWGIKGKSLKNLLLRNPKVLGYIVDCKGDCMALCTRCWVRF